MIRFAHHPPPGDDAGHSDPALAAAADAASIVARRQAPVDPADFVTVDLRTTAHGQSSHVMRALFDVREDAPVLILTVRTQ
jgi:ActR/RegA family two-component response regulator